jgi:integrase
MATIRKREWLSPKGEAKTAWLVDYRDGQGKRRSKQFARKRDAEAWNTKAAWEVTQGTHTADAASITVAQACQFWLDRAVREDLEESTRKGYDQRVRLHIKPVLGDEKLSRLSRPKIEMFRDLMVETRGKAMAAMIMRALSSIIGEAQRRGLVAQNVALGVRVKRSSREREPVVVPTKAELQAILKTASDSERPILTTAIFTGLRGSELRGLRWTDIDLKAGTLTVAQRADFRGTIGAPKSKAGYRTIPLPPALIAELKRWKLRCPNGKLGLAFPNGVGNVEMHSNIQQRLFDPCQIRAGVCDPVLDDQGEPRLDEDGEPVLASRYSMHALRHAAASLWIERRVEPKRVQSWLGHASIQLTFDTYGYLFAATESDAAVASAIEAELFG